MASLRVASRLSSRLLCHSLTLNKISLQSQLPASARRISRLSRLPVELSSLQSMMPLHSAIAAARLKSSLPAQSQSWGLVPQGISMPL